MTITWTELLEPITWQDQENPGVEWITNVGPVTVQGGEGQGVPTGGTTAQVLAKASDTDFDDEWVDQAASATPAPIPLTGTGVVPSFLDAALTGFGGVDVFDPSSTFEIGGTGTVLKQKVSHSGNARVGYPIPASEELIHGFWITARWSNGGSGLRGVGLVASSGAPIAGTSLPSMPIGSLAPGSLVFAGSDPNGVSFTGYWQLATPTAFDTGDAELVVFGNGSSDLKVTCSAQPTSPLISDLVNLAVIGSGVVTVGLFITGDPSTWDPTAISYRRPLDDTPGTFDATTAVAGIYMLDTDNVVRYRTTGTGISGGILAPSGIYKSDGAGHVDGSGCSATVEAGRIITNVPEFRTYAGLDFSQNRTVDEVKAALGVTSSTISTDDPQALGSADPGSTGEVSDAGHVHPMPSYSDVGAASAAQGTAASTAVQPSRFVATATGLLGGGDLSADRTLSPDFGTGAGKVTQGNDSRLSDARTPTAHASTHASAGSDPITIAESQVTNLTTDLAAKALKTTTIAGLDLSANRTAAALKTALAIANTDVSGLGTLATKSAIASADITDGSIVDADISASAAIALSKLANIADQRILGNVSGSTAAAIALTPAQILTALGLPAWVQLFKGNLNSIATKTLTFPVSPSRIHGVLFGGSTRAATADTQLLRLNGDTGSNYSFQSAAASTSAQIGNLPGATTNTDRARRIEFWIDCGSASPAFWTAGDFKSAGAASSTATTSGGILSGDFSYMVDALITSLTLLSNTASNWTTGTQLFVEYLV